MQIMQTEGNNANSLIMDDIRIENCQLGESSKLISDKRIAVEQLKK